MGHLAFLRVVGLLCLLILFLTTSVGAQGLQQTPYSAANVVRGGPPGGGLDLAPSNPLGLPGSLGAPRGPQSLYVSDGMLRALMPLIPNLQFGYLYDFGSNRVNTGRFTADYLLPFSLSAESEVFGEAHSEFDDFWNTLKSAFTHGTTTTYNKTYKNGFNNRVDLSFGGGFRSFVRQDTLVGVNGFYDTSRLGGTWYSSGGLGFEMAALMGNDALDFNFNWYGQLWNSNVIRNAFRYGPSNFDFQAGYSHELWNGGPDFRLSATGYKFDIGESVWGWDGGAELFTRDNMFVLKYAVGNDKVDRTYQTIGGFINVGFQLENLFRGESPFTKPEPIFNSPRHRRYMLTQPVRRNWHEPAAVVMARSTTCPLPGYRVLASNFIAQGPYYSTTPSIPDSLSIPHRQLVIHWAGVTKGATLTKILIFCVSPNYVEVYPLNTTQITPGCGSAVYQAYPSSIGFSSPPHTVYFYVDQPVYFEDGGGISFELQ